jgi:hypothetical protein
VPLELVSADYTVGGPTIGPLQSTTSGLAAGNIVLEAVSHALCETIERDALALWRLLPDAAQDATTLDLTTADAVVREALIERFSAAGVALRAFDVTSDIKVPCLLCLAGPAGEDDEIQPELGSGCHPDPNIAHSRAVAETAQARLTRIAGARDDLMPDSYGEAPRRCRAHAARLVGSNSRRSGTQLSLRSAHITRRCRSASRAHGRRGHRRGDLGGPNASRYWPASRSRGRAGSRRTSSLRGRWLRSGGPCPTSAEAGSMSGRNVLSSWDRACRSSRLERCFPMQHSCHQRAREIFIERCATDSRRQLG